MNKEIAETLSQKYLAPTVVVLLLLIGIISGGMGYVWSEYKEVIREREKLGETRQKFEADKVIFEKYKSIEEFALASRRLELDKREYAIGQREQENQDRENKVSKRAAEYDEAFKTLTEYGELAGAAHTRMNAENRLQLLMSEFTSMGIDLNANLRCGDTEGITLFNKAKAKFSEALALAQAYNLYRKYQHFFFINEQNLVGPCFER